MNKNISKNSGLSFLEILISSAIFVIGVVSVFRVISTAVGVDIGVDDRAVAYNFAQKKIETLFNTAYPSITASTPTCATNSLTWGQPDSTGYPKYYWCWTVTDTNANGISVLKQVVVNVVRNDGNGPIFNVSLTTLIVNMIHT